MDTSQKLKEIVRLALDKKAEQIVILAVGELTSLAEYFVIMSAKSSRQLKALADSIDDEMRRMKSRPLCVDGLSDSGWVIIDFGDVVVHVFSEEKRDFYNLEKLWTDAPRLNPESLAELAS